MELIDFVNKSVKVPFVEFGRSYDGWDCWGLVYCCYRDVYGIDLPSYADEYGSTSRRDELKALIEHHKRTEWTEHQEAKTGDVAILKLLGRPCHVGIMIDAKMVLHADAAFGTGVERVDRQPWIGKVIGFHRHETRQ